MRPQWKKSRHVHTKRYSEKQRRISRAMKKQIDHQNTSPEIKTHDKEMSRTSFRFRLYKWLWSIISTDAFALLTFLLLRLGGIFGMANNSELHAKRADRYNVVKEMLLGIFGPNRLQVRTNADGDTYWEAPPSGLLGYSGLSEDIRADYETTMKYNFGSPAGYVCLDTNSGDACVCDHIFTNVQRNLMQEDFRLRVVPMTQHTKLEDPGELPPDKQQDIITAISANLSALMAPNVILLHPCATMCIGSAIVHIPCIRAIVWDKGLIPLGSWVLPDTVDNIPVDIVSGSMLCWQARSSAELTVRSNSTKLYTGTCIETIDSRDSRQQATYGATVQFKDANQGDPLLGLTAGHFLVRTRKDEIVSAYRKGSISDIGIKHSHQLPDLDAHCGKQTQVDAGLLKLNCSKKYISKTALDPDLVAYWNYTASDGTEIPFPNLHAGIGRQLRNDQLIFKHGAITGLTQGKIARAFAQVRRHDNIPVTIMEGDVKLELYVTCYCECIYIQASSQPFSQEGDSGSLVFTQDGAVVGMVCAGNTDFSLACFVEDIEHSLGVSLLF